MMEEMRHNSETEDKILAEGEVIDRLASDSSGQRYFGLGDMGNQDLSGEEKDKVKGIIEAILFTMGDSVETERLSEVLELEDDCVEGILREMQMEYGDQKRGITLKELDGSWQICTKIETYDYIKKLVSRPKKRSLTDVLLETLSIIAYKQPVTRQEIEAIRGVKCDFAVNKLLEYGLVKELGRLDTIGHPIIFGTTEEFLRCFGVSSMEELPDIDEVKKQGFLEEAMEEVSSAIDVTV